MPRASRKRQSRLSFTPLASSSPASKDNSDSEPVRPTQRRNITTSQPRAKQPRLDFTNTRDPTTFDLPVQLPSSVRTRPSRGGMFSSQIQDRLVDMSDESDASVDLPSPGTLMKNVRQNTGRRTQHAARKAPAEVDNSYEVTVTGNRQQPEEISDEDDDDDIIAPTRRARKGGRMTRSSQMNADSDSEGITVKPGHQQPQEISDDDDDDDDMPTTMGTQRRRRRRESNTSFVHDSPPPTAAADSDDDVVEVRRSSRKRRRQPESSNEDKESTPEESTPKTHSSRKYKRVRKTSQQEKDDLADDLDFLGPSSDIENSPRSPRGTQSVQKYARLAALEKLKRKRSAAVEQVEEQGNGEVEDSNNDDDDDDNNNDDAEGALEEDSAEDEDDDLQYVSSRQMFKADKEDEDFLEEDDEGPLGVPEGLPIEFSRYASMKGKELFRFAIEWMVQKKINPGFRMNDDIYRLAFQKLDDEVQGLAASKFTSSAWTTSFTIAVQSRPLMDYRPIDRALSEQRCDACNRTGHPATYEIRFTEKPYHPETLEPVENDDEDEDTSDEEDDEGDDDDDDVVVYDAKGREVPCASKIFYVGRFCCANARAAHRLSHWKYHLNGFVLEWLDSNGYSSDREVTRREKWNTRKRGKYANKIADRMEQEGAIKVLWSKFKEGIDEARSSKQGRFGGVSP